MPQVLLHNLPSWLAQVFVIASVGALLPLLFRIRHPKTQLIYAHLVLLACAVLPLVQPWQHSNVSLDNVNPIVTTSTRIFYFRGYTHYPLAMNRWAVWILLAGLVARLGWLGIGLLQIRRHRNAARPLLAIPESFRLAIARIGTQANFSVSPSVSSPATMGFFRPTVLLPDSFLNLSPSAQYGILCHELLHVRRRDWIVTVAEEIASALFWFHPGVWWLLSQARLSREQLVDAQVVRLTDAREHYIAALLPSRELASRWIWRPHRFFYASVI